MSDKTYVYGDSNGASYEDAPPTHGEYAQVRTFWDSRIEVQAIAGTVQVGIVPPSEKSTDEQGLWDTADGRFLSLSRDGINRMIRALRECRDAAYGADA